MSTLLRKSRSSIYARAHADHCSAEEQKNYVNKSQGSDNGQPPPVPPKDTAGHSSFFHHFPSIRNRRTSRIDLSTAVESETSIKARGGHLQKQNPITQLSHRLVRKASTFNLHSGRLGGSPAPSVDASSRRSEYLFPKTELNCGISISNTRNPLPKLHIPELDLRGIEAASKFHSEAANTVVYPQHAVNTITRRDSGASQITTISVGPSSKKEQGSDKIYQILPISQDPTHVETYTGALGPICCKMANTTPPLPYEVLKKITVDACETALSSVKAYDHPKTESWNTTIINTILAQLVGETSGSSESSNGATAPKYKFVVNSTIVQHRNSMSEHAGGRRGMHSAAGAYWNNEKDGMWSFKYDAGDSKGLDVVVGIVWVWVG